MVTRTQKSYDKLRGPVRVPKASELVAGVIRGAIIRGEIKAGEGLPPEAELIRQYTVSRPTIREAMRILESERRIVLLRGARGGARVAALDGMAVVRATGFMLQAMGATIGDVYQALMLIEPEGAKLAAETRPREAAEALRVEAEKGEQAARDARNSEDLEKVRLSTVSFHRAILEQCGNITLAVIAQALDGVVDQHKDYVYRSQPPELFEERLRHIFYGFRSQHRLIELIELGRGEDAKQHWQRHMKNASAFWVDSIASEAIVEITP